MAKLTKSGLYNIFPGHFSILGLGHAQYSELVDIRNEQEFFRLVRSKCLSEDLTYSYDPDTRYGTVYGGFHTIGTFKRLRDL